MRDQELGLFGRSAGSTDRYRDRRERHPRYADRRPSNGRRELGRRGRRRKGRRRRGDAAKPLAPLLAIVLLALFVGGVGYGGYWLVRSYVVPPDYGGGGSGEVVIQVRQAATATEVANTLYRSGVVKSARAFVKEVNKTGKANEIQPGSYRLRRHMSAAAALALLLDPKSRLRAVVTVREGLRLREILQLLAQQTGTPLSDFAAAAEDADTLGLPSYANGKAEGYLFPATYDIEPKMSPSQVLRRMVQQYHSIAEKLNLEERARQVNLEPSEVVIVASLAQAEGGRLEDFPKIARVIYNRLNAGRKLELDSTVMYALNKHGIMASNADLKTPSRYNTYKYRGLPPGPINSPSEAALQAALNPAKGDWIYFVTTDPKRRITKFTASEQQFLRFKQELMNNVRQG